MNLYHTFPRGPKKHNPGYGLAVLESILDIGLLLTPEERTAPKFRDLKETKFLQHRVCFTALRREELPRHEKTFGSFSFEFNPANLREFGVLPAFYLSISLPNGELLHWAGASVLRSLVATRAMLDKMLKKRDGGTEEEKKLIYELHAGRPESNNEVELRELDWALDAILNLYYPTEDLNHNSYLGYYEQREWRITPNFAKNREWHYPKVDGHPKENLRQLNPNFFDHHLDLINGPRINECRSFSKVGEKLLLEKASCLLVPEAVITDAKALVKKYGYQIPVEPAPEPEPDVKKDKAA